MNWDEYYAAWYELRVAWEELKTAIVEELHVKQFLDWIIGTTRREK